MKSITVNFLSIILISSTTLGNILFDLGDSNIQGIEFTEDIEFFVSSPGEDSSLLLVLKDVYTSNRTIPGYSPSDVQVFSNAQASLNNTIFSDASWFAGTIDGAPPFPDGIDIESLDLLILYQFSGYDPFSSPWSLSVGDTITIKAGTIVDISDLDMPNPDILSGQISAQIFSSNFPMAFTEENIVTVVPEPGLIGFYLGFLTLGLVAFGRKRSNQSLVVTPLADGPSPCGLRPTSARVAPQL